MRPLFESLESRLLLSADLTCGITSLDLIAPVVPGQQGSATVSVINKGNAGANAPRIAVYASTDSVFDAQDVLLGGVTSVSGQVPAGQSKSATVPLNIPGSLVPGSYQVLAVVDPQNQIAESNEANNVSAGKAVSVAWKFGNVAGHAGSTSLTIRDADGTDATFSVQGPGSGEVVRNAAGWSVTLSGITTATTFAIAAQGGNGKVVLNDVHVSGPLFSLFRHGHGGQHSRRWCCPP
jgi:hypothetical protein